MLEIREEEITSTFINMCSMDDDNTYAVVLLGTYCTSNRFSISVTIIRIATVFFLHTSCMESWIQYMGSETS